MARARGGESMRKTLCILILICGLSIPITGLGEEGKRSNTQLNYMEYIGKGNRGEQLSVEEFNILIKQLEKSMKAFREAFLKIRIEDANFTYADGKNWEVSLTSDKKQLERAFKFLPYVRKHPNEISTSLQFYIDLMEVTQTAYEFAQIPAFDKKTERYPNPSVIVEYSISESTFAAFGLCKGYKQEIISRHNRQGLKNLQINKFLIAKNTA